MSKPPILAVDNISVRYARQSVLQHIFLQLHGGNIGIIAGCNGAGKSTLLRYVAGWLQVGKGGEWVGCWVVRVST